MFGFLVRVWFSKIQAFNFCFAYFFFQFFMNLLVMKRHDSHNKTLCTTDFFNSVLRGSILQENLNYSPALNVVCQILPQILPQLQSYRCLLTRGIKKSIFLSIFFLICCVSCCVCVTGANACLDPWSAPSDFVFLKLELCNLVNTFWRKFRAGNE